MEACYILMVMTVLLMVKRRRHFAGQLFLFYLMLYAAGRFVLEYFRGDSDRGFIVDGYLSNSQFIALCVLAVVCLIYWRRLSRAKEINVLP